MSHFFDLKQIFMQHGLPSKHHKYLFLGDYVDRGPHGLETINLLLILKIKYPEYIYLLRGNHETKLLTQSYGFFMECKFKYGDSAMWELFTDTFNNLPLTATINDKYYALHGGLSPFLEYVEDINDMDRFSEPSQTGCIYDILWSDPSDDHKGFKASERGAGYLFGSAIVDKFLERNRLKYIIRSHQLCMDGYQENCNGKVLTIWSAPNYCYRFKNAACVLKIKPDSHEYVVFYESSESAAVENIINQSVPDQ